MAASRAHLPTDGLPSTALASGIVVKTPTPKSAHPAPFRWSLLSRSAISKPIPTPSATRVPAISMISGIVMLLSLSAICLRPVSEFFRAARMPAIAGQFQSIPSIVAKRAAIFLAARHDAVASRMFTSLCLDRLWIIGHNHSLQFKDSSGCPGATIIVLAHGRRFGRQILFCRQRVSRQSPARSALWAGPEASGNIRLGRAGDGLGRGSFGQQREAQRE